MKPNQQEIEEMKQEEILIKNNKQKIMEEFVEKL